MISDPNGVKKVQRQFTTDTDSTLGQASSVGVYIATVKNNVDIQRMGRLDVWVSAFGGDPESESSWINVSYASPFAGTTSIFDQGANVESYDDTIKSYGFWAVPPALDAKVLVAFPSGRLGTGYWFACLFQTGTTSSIPGLPSGKVHSGEDKVQTNKNRRDKDPDLDVKVEHTLQSQLEIQGLEKDKLRGLTSSGAGRESPSKVVGILTPGQHQFIMDDGDADGNSRNIRFRTTGGTQVLIDDTVGHVYINSRDGSSWIELSADGRIHLFGADDISVHSDSNINMYAGKSINMQAMESVNIVGANSTLKYSSDGIDITTQGNMRHTVLGDATIKVTGQYIEKAALIHMNGPIPPDASSPQAYSIPTNTQITDAFVPIIPEHEPWAGHSGSINPKGPGSQQLKKDPAPKKVPQEPKSTDKGTPIVKTKEQDPADPKNIPVPVAEAKTSPEAVSCIRDKNDWRGYPYKDGDGTSVGYGSPVDGSPAPSTAQVSTNAGVPEEATGNPATADQHEELTGEKAEPTQEQLNDAKEVKIKKQEELAAKQADSKAKLAEVDGPDYAKTPNLTDDQRLAVIEDAKAKGIPVQQALNNSSIFGYGLPPTEEMKLRNEINSSGRNSIPNENLYGGVTKERSEQLLAQDISKSEAAVRSTLSSAGVQNVPPKVFDGLVSMHNQLGNVNYAFVGGDKINLTSMYQEGNWDRAASFIAADERDRPRRQSEANIMVNGDYGSPASADQVIARGLAKTQSLYINNRLNEQTGDTTNYAQQQAAASSWYKMVGTSLPGLNFSSRLAAQQNVMTNAPANKRWGY